ncbi:MAG: GNAT family N-acetyltransferase [Thermomicrobiales bacterium]
MEPRFRIEPFSRNLDRSQFACGEDALDRYLQRQAGQDFDRSLTAIFVAVDSDIERVAGFYTLSAQSIGAEQLPAEIARRLPRHPAPVTLLGRLAVDKAYQGQGLGRALLYDALQRAYQIRLQIGSMAVIVDAKHREACAFNERHEFRRLPSQEYRLFILMTTIGRLLEL